MGYKTIISSNPDTLKQYLTKIWKNRSLIITLAKRDIKVKYAQTIIGLGWTILQPLVAVVVYTLFFSILLNFSTETPYLLFVLSGILIWGMFNYIFSQGSASLIQNQDLIKKMYFPKIILPISKVLVALSEFVVVLILFIALFIFFKINFSFKILLTPFVFLFLILFSLGTAFILCAATIKNRDLNHIVPFLINFGIWFTPVFYPVSILPDQYKNFLYLNPMASILQLFRWCLFGDALNSFVFVGLTISITIFIIGFFYFKKTEEAIVDLM